MLDIGRGRWWGFRSFRRRRRIHVGYVDWCVEFGKRDIDLGFGSRGFDVGGLYRPIG